MQKMFICKNAYFLFRLQPRLLRSYAQSYEDPCLTFSGTFKQVSEKRDSQDLKPRSYGGSLTVVLDLDASGW